MRAHAIFALLTACASPNADVTGEGQAPGDCSDGADNDGDGLFDCNDTGCAGAPVCHGEVGVDGGVVVRDDAQDAQPTGPGWRKLTSGVTSALYGITGSGSRVYVVGDGGRIMSSSNAGTTWSVQASNTTRPLYSVWCDPAACNNAFAVGESGTIVHTLSSGAAWQAQTSFAGYDLSGVWGTSYNEVYVAGFGGTVRLSTNGGVTWTTPDSYLPTNVDFVGVGGRATLDAHFVGASSQTTGTVYTQTGTHSFTAQTVPTTARLNAVAGSTSGQLVAVGVNGTILMYVFSWQKVASGTTEHLWGVWAQKDLVVAVGEGGVILRSIDGGKSWKRDDSGVTSKLYAVWGTAAGDIFAVGENGTILHYTE